MWVYQKTLQHPVNIKNMDLKMAKYLITQFGILCLLVKLELF